MIAKFSTPGRHIASKCDGGLCQKCLSSAMCEENKVTELTEEPAAVKSGKQQHERRYFCDSCGAGFTFKYALRQHFKFHEKMEAKFYMNRCCHICMQDMKSIHALRTHLLAVHDITWKPGGNSYTCQKCFKPFDDLFKLRMHLKLYHDVSLPIGLRSPRLREFKCQVCQQTFSSESSARKHMRADHNLTNNQMESLKTSCEECGKMFSVKQNLLNHINSTHLKVKPMSCEICGERFVKHSSLIFHRFRHTGEKPFMCTFCQRTYRQRNDVIRHLARHVRDKEVTYETASAVNTSTSKYIFKRLIYLKDSTIKGLQDIARCETMPKKRKQAKRTEVVKSEPIEENCDEVVLTDETVLLEHDERTDNSTIEYIFTGDRDPGFIVNNAEDEGVTESEYNVIVDENGEQMLRSPGGSSYSLRVNEVGEQYFIRID